MMGKIMCSTAGHSAITFSYSDDIPTGVAMAIFCAEVEMARCPHMTEAVLTDRRTYCCDCGKILTAGEG